VNHNARRPPQHGIPEDSARPSKGRCATRKDEAVTKTFVSDAPLTEQAYRRIRGMILHQELRPGERTSVAELAKATGLGREPVKSAMGRLAVEKLLIMRGRSGTRVAKLEPHQIRQLFEMRRLYEEAAAPLIAERVTDEQIDALNSLLPGLSELGPDAPTPVGNNIVAFIDLDVEFHERVMLGANNPYLVDHYSSLNLHLLISHYLYLDRGFHTGQRHQEHELIVQAIKSREPVAIRDALVGHANAIEAIILTTMQETSASARL
jgi:DNA-binding GntR family transcriptional regulator